MPSLQRCELLTKNQILKKQSVTGAKHSNDHACQKSEGGYQTDLVLHSACGSQCCILLKSLADRILAKDSTRIAPRGRML
jgi:hypothetical protein